jgi:mono/diheme cytochrome c family protein
MRLPPEGTVARLDVPVASATGAGYRTLAELQKLETYKNGEDYVTENPLPATRENVLRGQERFNIHCAVCHDRSGMGQGLVLQRAQAVAPGAFNYNLPDLGKEPRLQESADGYLYEVIAMGKGTMPAYGHQVPVEDRWRIVHYLRVLQARFN